MRGAPGAPQASAYPLPGSLARGSPQPGSKGERERQELSLTPSASPAPGKDASRRDVGTGGVPNRSLRGDTAPRGGTHRSCSPCGGWAGRGVRPAASPVCTAGCQSISAAGEGASAARRCACRRSGAKPRAGTCPPFARCQGGAGPAPGAVPARGAQPGGAAVWPSAVNSRLLALPGPFSAKAVGTQGWQQGKGSKAAGREMPKLPCHLRYARRLL